MRFPAKNRRVLPSAIDGVVTGLGFTLRSGSHGLLRAVSCWAQAPSVRATSTA
ncbi:MAG: hypothetical protein ACLR4Z_12690 [Butyricicoccaceae bacterium]